MTSKNSQLKQLQKASVGVELSHGETVQVTKIRPFDEGGHHVFDLLDAVAGEFTGGEISLNLATITRLLSKHFKPNTESRAALEGAITHCSGVGDIKQLTTDDVVKIVFAVVELNMDFFAQAAPQLLARLSNKAKT